MPAKTPDCLLAVFARVKDAVDVLLRTPIMSHQLAPTSLATLAPSLPSKPKVALATTYNVLPTTLTTTQNFGAPLL